MEKQLGDQQLQIIAVKQKSAQEAQADLYKEAMKAWEDQLEQAWERMQKVEEKVCMYEAAQQSSGQLQSEQITKEVTQQFTSIVDNKIQAAIESIEKKIAAVVGASHKSSSRYTVNGLANKLQYNSRRVKELETLQGTSNICKTVRQLANMPTPPPTNDNGAAATAADSPPPSPKATATIGQQSTQQIQTVATQQVDAQEQQAVESAEDVLAR